MRPAARPRVRSALLVVALTMLLLGAGACSRSSGGGAVSAEPRGQYAAVDPLDPGTWSAVQLNRVVVARFDRIGWLDLDIAAGEKCRASAAPEVGVVWVAVTVENTGRTAMEPGALTVVGPSGSLVVAVDAAAQLTRWYSTMRDGPVRDQCEVAAAALARRGSSASLAPSVERTSVVVVASSALPLATAWVGPTVLLREADQGL